MVRFAITILAVLVSATTPRAGAAPAPAGSPKGVVRGVVVFEGTPPERLPIQRFTDPQCNKVEKLSEDVIVTDGKLKDVLVRIKNGALPGKPAAVPPPAVIDQKDCMYAPRVVGLVAGQKLMVRNSDGFFHNVHGAIAGAQLWNKPALPDAPELTLDGSARPGDVIDVNCDVHPWMHAYAVVQDHTAFAVTGSDGAFELTGLPPGSYTVEAWHPVLGTRSVTVKLGGSGAATTRLAFKREK